MLRTRVTVRQLFPEHGPAPVDARTDGPQLDAQGSSHFVVGEAFQVAKDDGGAEVRRQFLQGGLDIQVLVVQFKALFRSGFTAGQPGLRVFGEGIGSGGVLVTGSVVTVGEARGLRRLREAEA